LPGSSHSDNLAAAIFDHARNDRLCGDERGGGVYVKHGAAIGGITGIAIRGNPRERPGYKRSPGNAPVFKRIEIARMRKLFDSASRHDRGASFRFFRVFENLWKLLKIVEAQARVFRGSFS
jgi:hypothetical protein